MGVFTMFAIVGAIISGCFSLVTILITRYNHKENLSKEKLVLDYGRNDEGVHPLELLNSNREVVKELAFMEVHLTRKLGQISKITSVESCFKNTGKPYLNMTKHVAVLKHKTINFKGIHYRQEGKESYFWAERAINFYPERHSEIFYQFILLTGAQGENELIMYGVDTFPDGLGTFVMTKAEALSNVYFSASEAFRQEYLALHHFLKENGYHLL